VILKHFFLDLKQKMKNWLISARLSMCMQALMSSGTEIVAVVFGQHVHLTLILAIFV
jgi:hypothetical protein